MIKLYNMKGDNINVAHFHGQSFGSYPGLRKKILNNCELEKPSFDIISCWTDDNKCILKEELDKFSIPLINGCDDFEIEKWYMPNKIRYILSALKKATSEIVMILDGYDTLILTFDNLLERFNTLGYRILFNASSYNYPDENIDFIPNRDTLGNQCYFNAGCCIGYRDDLIKFYEECLAYIDIPNSYDSEQYVVRHAFADHSTLNDKSIFIDNENVIFRTMGKTAVVKADENKYVIF